MLLHFSLTKIKANPSVGDYRLTTQLISDRFISFISKPMLLGGELLESVETAHELCLHPFSSSEESYI